MGVDAKIPLLDPKVYLSPDVAKLEKEKLWSKVWQVACRVEELPEVGSYITYDIADESIIVTRAESDAIKAYHNVCPHRGRRLVDGPGKGRVFRCGYHGWSFDTQGQCVAVQDEGDWSGCLKRDELSLQPVRVGTWGGFVFVNMDLDCGSLEDYLTPIQEYLDPFEFESLRYRWYVELKVECNWKVALEAFMDGYHVAATHPQLLPVQGDDYTQSYAQGLHSHFGYWQATLPLGVPSPRLKAAAPKDPRPGVVEFFRQMEEDFGAIFTDRDYEASKRILQELPEGVDAGTAFGAAVTFGREAAEAEGAGYPENLSFEGLAKAGADWHVFPNCVTLPWFDGAVWYRARPDGDDPNRCIFNIWSLKRFAKGTEPVLERKVFEDTRGQSFGLIVDQDLANMAEVQKGMKSRAFTQVRPNPVQEVETINFHKHLAKFLWG